MSETGLRDESGGGAEDAFRLSVEHLEGHGYLLLSHLTHAATHRIHRHYLTAEFG